MAETKIHRKFYRRRAKSCSEIPINFLTFILLNMFAVIDQDFSLSCGKQRVTFTPSSGYIVSSVSSIVDYALYITPNNVLLLTTTVLACTTTVMLSIQCPQKLPIHTTQAEFSLTFTPLASEFRRKI